MNAKRFFVLTLVLAAVLALGVSSAAAQAGNGTGEPVGQGNGYRGGRGGDAPRGNVNGGMAMNGGGLMLNLPPASAEELPQDVIDLMVDGWMDEQHAYAVYQTVIAQFGEVRPFTSILNSEAQHIAAWEALFDRYGIAVPETPTFDVTAFASLSGACAVGASAEVANFDLYDSMLAAFEAYPDLQYVAQSLRDASEFSHLPAFERCAG
ncbi:MAG: hypothetical protein IPK19_04090 [Chloroflexi bacterium]|nr:hypothetical protein [Chloroflexota bacterium]